MLKEFLPAVEWLELDYDYRSREDMGWKSKSRYNPDGTYGHPELDLNTYRRGPYQVLDDNVCGDFLADICTEGTGSSCDHEDHQRYVECYCLQSVPGAILGLPWTEEDERLWLTQGEYRGDPEVFSKYTRSVHPYIYDHAL